MYCIDDPNDELTLIGIKRNLFKGKKHSHFRIMIDRCH